MKSATQIQLTALAFSIGVMVSPWATVAAQGQKYGEPAKADAAKKPEGPKNSVRSEVGKPVQAAQALVTEKKFAEALVKLNEAAAVMMKTPWETYVIERTRSAIAAQMGDNALMIKSIEAVFATDAYPAEDKLLLLSALSTTYFRLKDYAKTVEWGQRALAEPGVTNEVRLTTAQAAYLTDKLDLSKTQMEFVVDQAEKAQMVPPDSYYRLLASIATRQMDNARYEQLLRKLATHYYKKEYVLDLLARLYSQTDFSEKLMIDVRRLRFALGAVANATEYVSLAELTLRAGFPAEAKKVLDEAYSKGTIKDDDSERKKLRDTVEREFAEEQKAASRTTSTNKDPNALLNNGYNFVLQAQADKGLPMMEQAVANPVIKNPEESKLRLGIAYTHAGKRQQALDTFKSVGGSPALIGLAGLWALHAGQLPK